MIPSLDGPISWYGLTRRHCYEILNLYLAPWLGYFSVLLAQDAGFQWLEELWPTFLIDIVGFLSVTNFYFFFPHFFLCSFFLLFFLSFFSHFHLFFFFFHFFLKLCFLSFLLLRFVSIWFCLFVCLALCFGSIIKISSSGGVWKWFSFEVIWVKFLTSFPQF